MNTILENRNSVTERQSVRQSGRQTWMVSFADLMAILLTFMVISFSTKEISDVPWQQMSRSMLETFSVTTASEAPALTRGSTGSVASDASDEVVAELIADRFPDLGSTGGVKVTARGVEIDVAGAPDAGEASQRVTRYLVSLDRDMLVSVVASLPGPNPGSVQRTLAWENGLTAALELRSRLLEQGLSRRPDVQVTMGHGGGRTTLVVKSAGRAR